MTSIDDFVLLNELGKGSFGSVYKVKRNTDGEIYAMKKVLISKLNQKEKDNAINEIRILASIKNQNIISYKEAFYDERSSYLCIIMEYADDGDLESKINQKIKSNTFFTQNEVINIFIQIINGLKVLHERKIIHRDLKSANIFMTKNGLVKLGDLNVSKVLKMGLGYTQTGTPYYAAPEVWKDMPYDFKADIWSLGCILYEMTCLKPPFRGNNMEAVYNKIMKGVYDPLPRFYSKELVDIVALLLQINASSRPKCDRLIEIINKTDKFVILNSYLTEESNKDNNNIILLETIRIPKNIKDINKILPKSNYTKKRINSSFNIKPHLTNSISSNSPKNNGFYLITDTSQTIETRDFINKEKNEKSLSKPMNIDSIISNQKIQLLKNKYNINYIPIPKSGLKERPSEKNCINYNYHHNNSIVNTNNNYNNVLDNILHSNKENSMVYSRANSASKETKDKNIVLLPKIQKKVLNLSKIEDQYDNLKTEATSKHSPASTKNIPNNRINIKNVPKKQYNAIKLNNIPLSKIDLFSLK